MYILGDPSQLLSKQRCAEPRGALSKTQASIYKSNLCIKFTRWLSGLLIRYNTAGGLMSVGSECNDVIVTYPCIHRGKASLPEDPPKVILLCLTVLFPCPWMPWKITTSLEAQNCQVCSLIIPEVHLHGPHRNTSTKIFFVSL